MGWGIAVWQEMKGLAFVGRGQGENRLTSRVSPSGRRGSQDAISPDM